MILILKKILLIKIILLLNLKFIYLLCLSSKKTLKRQFLFLLSSVSVSFSFFSLSSLSLDPSQLPD